MFENKMRELVLIAFLEKYGIDSDRVSNDSIHFLKCFSFSFEHLIELSQRSGWLVTTDRKYANTISRRSVTMDEEESLDGMKSSATILSLSWDGGFFQMIV